MRAQIYSLLAVVIMIPLTIYVAYYITSLQGIKSDITTRILADQMNEIVKNIQKDFIKAIEICGRRAVLAAANHVIKEGQPLDNASFRIKELMVNGTLYGNGTYIMINNTVEDWKERINITHMGFRKNFDSSEPIVENHDGFNLKALMKFVINVSDSLERMSVNREIDANITFSVTGMEDPIFPLNTGGRLGRIIKVYPYPYHAKKILTGISGSGNCSGNFTFNVSDENPGEKILVIHNASGVSGFLGVIGETADLPSVSCYVVNTVNAIEVINSTYNESGYPELYIDSKSSAVWSLPVTEAIEYGYYTHFAAGNNGPDIFLRLEGKLSSSQQGIESFINLPELEELGIPVKTNQISIDYLYFSDENYIGYPVRGLPEWFRIDATHGSKYNLTELIEGG